MRYIDIASVSWTRGVDSTLVTSTSFGEAPGRARRIVREGDVLVSTVRPNLRAFAQVPSDFDGEVASTGFAVVRAKEGRVAEGFAWALISSDRFVNDMVSKTTGSNYPAVRAEDVKGYKFTLPPLHTQKRIVEVIGAVDDQISALEVEADALDALLRGRKEQLFAHYAATATMLPIGEVLKEVKRPITVDPEAEYRQIGIRSHGRGLFTKEAVTGESLGSKRVFWVEPGDLVINIVFAWEGAVAIVPPEIEGYCGSHRFPAYRRLDGGDVEFFRLFFSTKTGTQLLASCSPGGAGRNRTLNRKRLMQSPIGMPPAQEQDRAICMLQALEATVVAARAETDRLRAVRAALLSGVLDRNIELADAEREA
jgi:type I restriction enzyme S subunit